MKKYLLCLLLFSCSSKKPPDQAPIYPVHVAAVEKKDVPIVINTIGHVDPITSVQVVSRVKGEILDVFFKQGQYVEEGDLLFTIDPRTFQAELERARAQLEENKAKLSLAIDKVERFRPLTEERYYSRVDFDQLCTDQAALENLVKQNEADVIDAEVNLGYCWIYSPIEGRTGILQIDRGNVLKGDESQTLVTINQMKPIYVTFSIPEKEVQRVRKFMHAYGKLKTLALIDQNLKEEGYLYMLNNEVDKKTGMIKLRSEFPNENEMLWPNEFVRTRLELYVEENALVIPYQAVDMTATGPHVYVVKPDHTVSFRKVELGQRENGQVIVYKGVHSQEMVVTEGMQNLSEGVSVSIKNRL